MKLKVFKNRVERYNLLNSAGKYYADEMSEIVKSMNANGKRALLGIENGKGQYTLLGDKVIYYSTSPGKSEEISFKEFIEEFDPDRINKKYFRLRFLYKSAVVSNNKKIWFCNRGTLGSIWLTVLWMSKLPEETSFE